MWNAWFDRANTFAEFDALTREIEMALQRNAAEPQRFDVREDPTAYVLQTDVPGLAPEAVKLDVQDGVLTLKAERGADVPKGYEARHRERLGWRLSRSFALPDNVDVAGISAKVDSGTLYIALPKKPAMQPRHITVNT